MLGYSILPVTGSLNKARMLAGKLAELDRTFIELGERPTCLGAPATGAGNGRSITGTGSKPDSRGRRSLIRSH